MGKTNMSGRIFSLSALFALLPALAFTSTGQAAKGDACAGFSKGAFTGGVASKAQCRTACEKAEGCTKEFNGVLEKYQTCGQVSACSCQCALNDYRTVCGDCSGIAGLQPMNLLVGATIAMALFLIR